MPSEKHPRPDDLPDEAPETPPDDPQPAPVQDPPAEPVQAPYVVRGRGLQLGDIPPIVETCMEGDGT
jgi:hypothetical protein